MTVLDRIVEENGAIRVPRRYGHNIRLLFNFIYILLIHICTRSWPHGSSANCLQGEWVNGLWIHIDILLAGWLAVHSTWILYSTVWWGREEGRDSHPPGVCLGRVVDFHFHSTIVCVCAGCSCAGVWLGNWGNFTFKFTQRDDDVFETVIRGRVCLPMKQCNVWYNSPILLLPCSHPFSITQKAEHVKWCEFYRV